MSTAPLGRTEKRFLLATAVIAAASVFYTLRYYSAAFPEASLELEKSKPEITALAQNFLRGQGLATEGFRELTLFEPDAAAKTYLERELGLEEANRLMKSEVSVWRWRARWFRPPEQEEFIVYVSPSGKVVGFEHVVPEASPGQPMDRDAAYRLAEGFLKRMAGGQPQRLIEEKAEQRPAREDYTFTWEREGFRARDASYRRTVVVKGDRIGRYSEWLHVPEEWRRDFARLRSSNQLYQTAAESLYVILIIAAVVALIRSLRRREIVWKPLLLISGAIALLTVVNETNSLPFFIDGMPTSASYSHSLWYGLLAAIGAGTGAFFLVIVAAAAGEPMYRRLKPEGLSVLKLPTVRAMQTKEFFLATAAGYGFAAVHLAFLVAFYLIGSRFGAWSPQDVNYSDFLSTKLPWIYPLTISLLASFSEEFWFRLLAIPLLKRWLRSTWLAVLIPAFLWGFLHANYPQQPGYIRGLEVGIIGVGAGFLMLRFGIVSTLVWHYTVDAVLIGMFLFQSGNFYFQASGWLVAGAVAFPLAVSAAFCWRRGGFLDAPELLNNRQVAAEADSETAAARQEPAPETAPALPAAWPRKWLYVAAAAAAGLGVLAPKAAVFGDFIRVQLSRGQAEEIASRQPELKVRNLEGWRRLTSFESNLGVEPFEYLRQVAGAKAASEAVRDYTATGLWRVRLFKPLNKEEWLIWVDQQGRAERIDHLLDEKASGARLEIEQARRLAEEYVSGRVARPSSLLRLADASSEDKEGRRDHSFVWEDPGFQAGEAKARIAVSVQGDEPSGPRRFLKLPEEWLREFRRPRLAAIAGPAGIGAACLFLLIVFFRRLAARGEGAARLRWRWYAYLGGAGAGAAALSAINGWTVALAGYNTAQPLANYQLEYVIGRVMVAAVVGAGLFLAAMAADVFLQWVGGSRPIARPSVWRAAAGFGLLWGVERISAAVIGALPGPRFSLPLWELPGAGTYSPAVAVLTQSLVVAALVVCAAAVAVSAAIRLLPAPGRYGVIVAAAMLMAATRAQDGFQLAGFAAVFLLWGAVVVLAVKTCGADVVTFGVALFWLSAAGPAAGLLGQPEAGLRVNGAACVAGALAIGFAALRRRGPRTTAGA